MGKLIKYIFILVLLLLIALAAIPFKTYYPYLEDELLPLRLDSISGSLVKGSAETASYHNQKVGSVDWFLYPTNWNALGGSFKIYNPLYAVAFKAGKDTKGSYLLEHIKGILDLQLLSPFIQLSSGKLTGEIQIDLSSLIYTAKNGVEKTEGEIKIGQLGLAQYPNKQMGDIVMRLETLQVGQISGQITSESPVMQVSGTLFLQPHRWQLNMDIIPNPGEFELQSAINRIGSARRGGGRKLQLAGFY